MCEALEQWRQPWERVIGSGHAPGWLPGVVPRCWPGVFLYSDIMAIDIRHCMYRTA